MNSTQRTPFLSVTLLAGLLALGQWSAPADTFTQTVAGTAGTTYNGALWGTPAAAPTSGNSYITPSGFDVRTPDSQTASTFAGDSLQIDSGGRFILKNGGALNGIARANLILNGGSITYNTANGTTISAVGGTLNVAANSTINSVAGAATRDIWLLSSISGTGNLTISGMVSNTAVVLHGTNTGFSGNWTVNVGRLEIGTNAVNPLGSGTVTIANGTNSLVFNTTSDLTLNNAIGGTGSVLKRNSGSVVLTANHSFTGGLTNQMGLLVLGGTSTQSYTRIDSNAVLRVANSGALPSGSGVRVNSFDAQTGRLELSNNVTIATGLGLELGMRGNASPALQSIHGNNLISDQILVSTGGAQPARIQVDAGSTLELAGGISTPATGIRSVGLQGDGNGTVNGYIDNGSATMSVYKGGAGTWTLNGYNYYSGSTVVSNGMLKLGASASIASSALIQVEGAGTLDATLVPGGLALNFSQNLRGNGAVAGAVSTSAGCVLEVGFTNQYGPLAIGGALTLNGSDTLRFDVGPGTNDVLNVAGALTLNGPTTIEVGVPAGFADNGSYRLINYTGTIQGGGSFTLVPPASRQNFTIDTATAGQVNLIVTGNPTNLVWSGDGSGNVWDVGTSANWNNQTEVFYNADHVTFNDSGSATPDIYVPAPVSVGTMTVSNTAQAYTLTGAAISTASALTKRGNNVLALANDGNAFTGPINLEAGTLSIGNGGGSGSLGSGPIANSGELLLNRSAGGNNVSGQVSGPGTVRVTGGGALSLSGSNSYTGVTTIETGSQLGVLNNFALGSTNAGTVVQSGGSVRFTAFGNWFVDEPLTINGDGLGSSPGALYANTTSNRATWAGPVTLGSASRIRIVNPAVRLTVSGPVIGDQTDLATTAADAGSFLTFSNTLSIGNLATLTKDGSGTVVLAGSSNLAGATVINGGPLLITTTSTPHIGDVTVNTGTLQLGSGAADGALPDGFINLSGASTRLVFNSSNSFVLNKELSGAGGITLTNYAHLTINSSNTFAGTVTTGAGTPIPGGTITLNNSYGLGDEFSPKNVTLIRAELQLTGGLTIPSAISFITSGGALANSPGGELIPLRNLGGNNTIAGTITLGGGGADTVVASDNGTLTLNGVITPNTTARTLILRGAGSGVINGAFDDNGTNVPALLKQGAGTWTLNTVNSYSGQTTIQGGTLALGASASIASTPVIQLQSNAVFNVSALGGGFPLGAGQVLSGNGTVIGNVAASGTVSPGTSVGTLNFASNLALSGVTLMELNRTNAQNADLITAAALTFGGTLTVTNLGGELQAGDTFNLFDGTINGQFALTNLPALSSTNLSWDTSLLNSQGVLKVIGNTATPPTLTGPARSGTNLTFQVASEAGFNYILEATPQLSPATWTGIETNAGGGVLNFTIPITPGNSKEFFRIRVE